MGAQISIPQQLDQSLPDIVKIDINYPKIKTVGIEGRELVTRRIISMLNVRFENAIVSGHEGEEISAEDLAISEFKSFIRDFDLTTEEIIKAYKLALKKELSNSKGDIINVYPNLDLIQCGEILSAYQRYKMESLQHTIGISKIKKYLEEQKEAKSPEELQKERQERFNNLVKLVIEHDGDFSNREFSIASFFYDDFKDKMPEISKEEKQRILIAKQQIEINKEKKRENKLYLTKKELKKADDLLSSGAFLPKGHVIYNLAVLEIKKELVINFILETYKK